MKKVLLLSIGIIFLLFSNISVGDFHEGRQYSTLVESMSEEPRILEFFSFYCLSCYQLEEVYHISNEIKKKLSKKTKIVRYHVEFLGLLGKELTHAWSVAMALGVEEKVFSPIFEAIQKTQTVRSIDDIRNIFIKNGIKEKDYDAAWNSFLVKSLTIKQKKMVDYLKLKSAPSMFINGRYKINPQSMNKSKPEIFVEEYVNTVRFLIEKDKNASFKKA